MQTKAQISFQMLISRKKKTKQTLLLWTTHKILCFLLDNLSLFYLKKDKNSFVANLGYRNRLLSISASHEKKGLTIIDCNMIHKLKK